MLKNFFEFRDERNMEKLRKRDWPREKLRDQYKRGFYNTGREG